MNAIRTQVLVDRELPPTVNAAGELEDQDSETVEYTALWYVEGPSGDGRNEPFTPAYPVIDAVVDAAGVDVSDDPDVMSAAENAVNAAFNAGTDAFEWDDGFPDHGDDWDIQDYGPDEE